MPVQDLSDRVALVTGASGGIGAALAQRLADAGAAVAVHYRSNGDVAKALVDRIADAGGRAAAFGADLSDAAATEQLAADVAAQLGAVDILAANAGLGRTGRFEDVDATMFDEMLAINLRAPFLLTRAVLPAMRERGWGRIVFTSSVAARNGGLIGGGDYAAAKAGLHGLAHHIAPRVAPDGVTLNVIAPALIEETTMLPGDPGGLAERIPVGRLGKPGEVADLVMALVRNGYITNQVIGIDGGVFPSS